jgi:outer membrane protein TolC
LAANLGFNRKHQQIPFGVQRAFYGLTSVRARIAVAQSSLDAARAVQEATEIRLNSGLATRPELALARQQTAQATFELEEVLDKKRDAQVTLAESIGTTPTTPIQVTVAALRASEADVNRARAAYWPTLSLVGDVGSILGSARITADGKSTGWFGATQPSYGTGLSLEWEIFHGRLDVAAALVEASQQSYEDSLKSYRVGLGTLTDLLAARRELSRARFVPDTRSTPGR